MKKLENTEKMLDKKEGYKAMKDAIYREKRATRQTLAIAADINRKELKKRVNSLGNLHLTES